jgi:hypothetical protein
MTVVRMCPQASVDVQANEVNFSTSKVKSSSNSDLPIAWITGPATDPSVKVLEYVSFFLGGKKCQKIVNIGVMRKDQAAQQRLFSGTILRGLTQPLNAYGYKYFSLLFLLFCPFVVPADLSQQAKRILAVYLRSQRSQEDKPYHFKIGRPCPF